MNIFFGITIAVGCLFSFFGYLPLSILINTWNDNFNNKSKIDKLLKRLKLKTIDSYKKLVDYKNGYTVYSIVILNLVCFISQFFDLSHDLKIVILIIGFLFLLGVMFSLTTNKYLKQYVALLQDSVATEVSLKNYFKIEFINSMPEQYKCYGEFMKIKDKLYYHKDDTMLAFTIKNRYYKKVGDSELDYIVDQLNNINENFNDKVKIKSLYKIPQLDNYSKFIVNSSNIDNYKPKKLILFNKFYVPISIMISGIYFILIILSIAACCGTNWFFWLPI